MGGGSGSSANSCLNVVVGAPVEHQLDLGRRGRRVEVHLHHPVGLLVALRPPLLLLLLRRPQEPRHGSLRLPRVPYGREGDRAPLTEPAGLAQALEHQCDGRKKDGLEKGPRYTTFCSIAHLPNYACANYHDTADDDRLELREALL